MMPDEAKRAQQRLGVTPDGQFGAVSFGALFTKMGTRDMAPALGLGAAKHFPAYRIDTPLRLAHWLAQFGVESKGFTAFEEDLYYKPERMRAIWPGRFPTIASALPYARNPEVLANKSYGGRMGNTQPGDGWRFRGRPALTGRENYTSCAARTGLDLVNNPDLASDPVNFVHIGCDYWSQHCCNPLADADDIVTITERINGGRIGLADRRAALAQAKGLLL